MLPSIARGRSTTSRRRRSCPCRGGAGRTAEFAAVGVTSLLEAVRAVDPTIRVYQASSSEIFGEPAEVPQTGSTPLAPVTPYGVAKAYGHFIVGSYRRRYGLHASCGILYNHESPRLPRLPAEQGRDAAAEISLGSARALARRLDAQRDWGYACDAVEAMWRIVQRDEPGDYVIATGELHSVEELGEIAFHVGLDWREHVGVDESLKRGPGGAAPSRRRRVAGAPRARLGAAVGSKTSCGCSSMRQSHAHEFVTPPP